MTQAPAAVVRQQIVVQAPIETAFEVFTQRFGDFKPREHNMLAVPIAETVFEPRVGGHIVDRGVDGSECRWARVLVYEPPARVVFSWDIGPTWQVETEPENTSEVGAARAPQHRPARPRLGGRGRRRRPRRGLAAVPGALRHPVRRGPLMPPITVSAEVDRPAEAAFAYVTDPSRFPEWQAGVVRGHMDGGGTEVGARCVTVRRIGGAERSSTSELVQLDPPRAWAVRGLDGPIRAAVDVTVEPRGADRSSVTIAVDFTGHGIGKVLVSLLVRRQARKEMPANLARLKERIEQSAS
jgi:uncharacterized protein YndB with AHSA1/START domain